MSAKGHVEETKIQRSSGKYEPEFLNQQFWGYFRPKNIFRNIGLCLFLITSNNLFRINSQIFYNNIRFLRQNHFSYARRRSSSTWGNGTTNISQTAREPHRQSVINHPTTRPSHFYSQSSFFVVFLLFCKLCRKIEHYKSIFIFSYDGFSSIRKNVQLDYQWTRSTKISFIYVPQITAFNKNK